MKIALAQMNQTVGDLSGNAERIISQARRASAAQADLLVTSELSLPGYPPRDCLLWPSFQERISQTIEEIADALRDDVPVLVGISELNAAASGRPLFNAAVLLNKGRVQAKFRKSLLPTYDVFDEDRYFEPAQHPQVMELNGRRIGVTICEDVWNDRDSWDRQRYHNDPVEQLAQEDVSCIVNLSASPFSVGKQVIRESMLGDMARRHRVPIMYVNQVGGNDDLVFDGRSCGFNSSGELIARGRGFEEDLVLVDLQAGTGTIAQDSTSAEEETYNALVLGTRDYIRKCGFQSVILGLSGGIDSAVTAVIAAAAVGPANVLGVMMPSQYSSRGSVTDSEQLARNLGIRTLELPVSDIMAQFEQTLSGAFAGYAADVTEENLQARIRGNLLMALSNKYGSLLLTTGNKSEMAVGYCTIYGDMSGGLGVLSDVFKTPLYSLARWVNREQEIIPDEIITKPPSAELRPDQKDQDSLPDYEVLDDILKRCIERCQSPQEIIASGRRFECTATSVKARSSF